MHLDRLLSTLSLLLLAGYDLTPATPATRTHFAPTPQPPALIPFDDPHPPIRHPDLTPPLRTTHLLSLAISSLLALYPSPPFRRLYFHNMASNAAMIPADLRARYEAAGQVRVGRVGGESAAEAKSRVS